MATKGLELLDGVRRQLEAFRQFATALTFKASSANTGYLREARRVGERRALKLT